ncbi:hypothetical protein EJ04DRAFT_514711 [Polyplosphaeria fusca]|uniref:Uncharacterized protein n=1 Tax=Polyplosphaeria fusca TaxID=682080 RepID=A0A9P4UZT2_9PLEO|nr:hypothetical protein EJ04DRAFT_514711 [Polyplosphaeria fusca]
MPTLTPGKTLLALLALATILGPYLADWKYLTPTPLPTQLTSPPPPSETHVLNPNWPPHARFHNGQTMTTGLMLGLLTLLYLRAPPVSARKDEEKSNINHALLFLHLYYVPALSGALYPGALFIDPEFGEGKPQLWLFMGFLGVAWWGWGLEMRRLGGKGRGG